MLRIFWPTTSSTKWASDVDALDPTVSGALTASGRFADTTAIAPDSGGTGGLYSGFLRTVNASGALRIAFDFYHIAYSADYSLLAVVPTTSTSYFSSVAANAKTLLTVHTNRALNRIAVSLGGTTLTLVGNTQLQNYEWYHVEVEFKPAASGGVLKVWVNDIEQTDITSGHSGNTLRGDATVTSQMWFYFGSPRQTTTWPYLSSLMVWDDSGTSDDLTGYMGDFTPIKLLPTGNGSHNDSTVTGAGTRWEAVADSDAATYISFDATDQYDLFDVTTLSISTGTIRAVVVLADGFLGGNGEAYLKGVCKSGAVTEESTVVSSALTTNPGASRAVLSAAFPVDPNTGVAWTVSGINSAEFGVKSSIAS